MTRKMRVELPPETRQEIISIIKKIERENESRCRDAETNKN